MTDTHRIVGGLLLCSRAWQQGLSGYLHWPTIVRLQHACTFSDTLTVAKPAVWGLVGTGIVSPKPQCTVGSDLTNWSSKSPNKQTDMQLRHPKTLMSYLIAAALYSNSTLVVVFRRLRNEVCNLSGLALDYLIWYHHLLLRLCAHSWTTAKRTL